MDSRLNEPTQTDKEVVQDEGADVEMNDAQKGNENLVITQEQVIDDAHVTISTVTKKTEVPVTSSSRSSDLAHANAEIVSPLDVHVHHEVPSNQTPTLLYVPISVIPESSPVFTAIPKLLPSLSPSPLLTTPTPPPIIATINPLSILPDFALSLTARIKEQVKDQLPQILPKEVSNFAPPVIEKLIKESLDEVTLAKVSSKPQSTYEAASTLIEFELKKIILDKIEKNKDNDEDPSTGSDRGLKKRKLSKDAEPTTGPKKKDSTSSSSKGTKSQSKSSGKSVQLEEPVFEVADSDIPQDQEGNLGDNEDEPRNETVSRRDWFKKPTPPQEPTNPD
ncbi:hypothetical protein Tco_1398882 [Tanacetum coccineum]